MQKRKSAANRQQYDIGFDEPYFLGRELEAGIDAVQDCRERCRIIPQFRPQTPLGGNAKAWLLP